MLRAGDEEPANEPARPDQWTTADSQEAIGITRVL